MVYFTKESLAQLRARIDLQQVLSEHLSLKRAGASFQALCPFHDERSPSFTLQKGASHYHCFGCGAHGDAVQFLMQHLRMGFQEAVQHLADRFQVQLEEKVGTQGAPKTDKKRLRQANDQAARFFHYLLLHTEEGRAPLAYLAARHLYTPFLQAFCIGLAPREEGLFRRFMHDSGYPDAVLEEAGLLVRRQGRLRDAFTARITFPIRDAQGQVIGFSCRKFDESTFGGKYINTQETPLFKKSRALFGLAECRQRLIKERQAIIVEGQLDALRLIYHGFDLTVAALGTAFGEEHVAELCRLGMTRVFLMFDSDEAGQEAQVKVGQLFQQKGVAVSVVSLPPGKDPDALFQKEGPLAIVRSLYQAQDYLAFLWRHRSRNVRLDVPEEKHQLLGDIVGSIRSSPSAVIVHESLKKLAQLANVPEEVLGTAHVRAPAIFQKRHAPVGMPTVDPDRILEADLLRWLILSLPSRQDAVCLIRANIADDDLRVPIAKKLYRYLEEKTAIDLMTLVDEVDDEEAAPFLSEILAKKVPFEKVKSYISETITRIKERNLWLKREEIKNRLASGASEEEQLQLAKAFDECKPVALVFPEKA